MRNGGLSGGSHQRPAGPRSWLGQRLATVAVLLAGLALSATVFGVAQRVSRDQEARLLHERAGEVGALLTNTIDRVDTSLRLLAALAGPDDAAENGVDPFTRSASTLLGRGARTVGVAQRQDGGFRVVRAVGEGPVAGDLLAGDRARLAERATRQDGLVSGLLDISGGRVLVATLSVNDMVAYHETALAPTQPVPSPADSPFRELRVALYASERADPERLVLTTERTLSFPGQVERVPFEVGGDRWHLVVGARRPLLGSFARGAPWLLLACGIICALLCAGIVDLLARRRAYATRLVDERTVELKRADDELRRIRNFLERLLTSGPVLVRRVKVPERTITYVSPNIERLFGVTEAEALAPAFFGSLVHAEDRGLFGATHDAVATGASGTETAEYRLRTADGGCRWVSATLVPETDDDGRIVAVIAYVVDVDGQRRAEQARRAAQDEAERANRAKTEFLSRMSHELRTPLNAVLGFGQLLELDTLTDSQRDSVSHILKGGRHLLTLINEVLDISRVESGDLGLSPEPVLASELVDESVALIRPLADERDIQLVVDHTGCGCFLYADRQRAKQVLLNLLSNAVKYNRPRGTVAVSCEQASETCISIRVSDTGIGIPAERLGLLFTPFQRLGAEQTGEEGTGIGLALSRRLAEAMGGTVSMVTTLGQGSTFSVELPLVEGPVERYERLGKPSPPAQLPAPATEQVTVLHIEDNLANLNLVERVLAQRPGISVVAAMQGRLGLELARQHRPVLVLLDLHLPDMVGDELLQRLRDDPVTASIPVVIVSADATPGQIRRLLSAGAASYLTKPIDVTELLRVLDQACAAR